MDEAEQLTGVSLFRSAMGFSRSEDKLGKAALQERKKKQDLYAQEDHEDDDDEESNSETADEAEGESDKSPIVVLQGPRGLVVMRRARVAKAMKEKKLLDQELTKARYGSAPSWPPAGKLRPYEVLSNQSEKNRYPDVDEMVLVDATHSLQINDKGKMSRKTNRVLPEKQKGSKVGQFAEANDFTLAHVSLRESAEKWNRSENKKIEEKLLKFNQKQDLFARKRQTMLKRPSWKDLSQLQGTEKDHGVDKTQSKTDVYATGHGDLLFGSSMMMSTKTFYTGLSSYNNFIRSVAEETEEQQQSDGIISRATSRASTKGMAEETKENLIKQKEQLDALLKDPSALDASVYGADGSLRTLYTLPPLEATCREARKARYLRDQKFEVSELNVDEIFPTGK